MLRSAGFWMVFASAALFASKAIWIKLCYRYHIDAISLLAVRMIFSLPFFAAPLIRHYIYYNHIDDNNKRLGLKPFLYIAGTAVWGYYLSSLLDFKGLEHISAGLERLILFLYPTITVFIGRFWFGKKLSERTPSALALTYAGLMLAMISDVLTGISTDLVSGSLMVFGAAITYAIYLNLSENWISRFGAPLFTAAAMTASTAMILSHFTLQHNWISLWKFPAEFYLLCGGLALFSTVIPAYLLSAGMSRIGSSDTAIIGSVGPLITIYLAWAVLNEPVTLLQSAGSVLVIWGVLRLKK